MRYISFGRHFTKVDKLKEVVNRLRWYVQDGDTIVDFCCGSNDFSCLMKEELDRMGKKCQFRNFDLIQPKVNYFIIIISASFMSFMVVKSELQVNQITTGNSIFW
uniref:Protein ENHANCED DOWNY MILDEW 2-like n=1 Tax=Nicotiana tabacum TaxID=4097 RepID=A0A1S4AVZ4_TOBAC|nr:PREDICTED: protein ENHANCED DOWNY MILDEW 2-like [Nicotiana tabacum]